MTTDPTALDLLKRTEALLSALHGSVARHDNLAANLGCAGCELRDRISAALPTLTEPVPAAPPVSVVSGQTLRDRVAGTVIPLLLDTLPKVTARARGYEIADAVLAVLPPPADRAAVLRWAADQIDAETRQAKADETLEPDKYRPCRDASAQLRALAGCQECASGLEHDTHCPTPESHNWGCGCPSDRINLHAQSGIDTPGCDCGHPGMGLRWHGEACAWVVGLLAEARELLAKDDTAAEAQQQPERTDIGTEFVQQIDRPDEAALAAAEADLAAGVRQQPDTETHADPACVCGHPIRLHHEDVCLRTSCGCADALETSALPEALEAVLTKRFTELGNPFSEMRVHEQGPDGWPSSHPVGPHQVAEVLRELLTTPAAVAPGGGAGQDEAQTPCGPAPNQCDDEAGEPCGWHEIQQAHGEGEHAFCGDECEEAK